MKPNLNTHILDGQTYLQYLFENKQIEKTIDLELFCSRDVDPQYRDLVNISNTIDFDILPYIYTLSMATLQMRLAFMRFHMTYLYKLEKDQGLHGTKDWTKFMSLISSSIEHLMFFIISAQYFFL
jgi:hypothetical protein